MARWPSNSNRDSTQGRDDADRRRLLPGRSQFIVPPTAVKSSYYNNPIARELWQQAGRRLHAARRIALVGYSLPLTDLVVAGMLAQHVSRSAELSIVNLDSLSVRERLTQLGFGSNPIIEIQGQTCVEEFVDQLEASANRSLLEKLTTSAHLDRPMCIAWNTDKAVAVTDVRSGAGELVVIAEGLPDELMPFRRRERDDAKPVPWGEALSTSASAITSLRAEFPDGTQTALVAAESIVVETGYGDGRWTALVPAIAPW